MTGGLLCENFVENKRDKSSLTVSTLRLWLALHSVTGWKETGALRTGAVRFRWSRTAGGVGQSKEPR